MYVNSDTYFVAYLQLANHRDMNHHGYPWYAGQGKTNARSESEDHFSSIYFVENRVKKVP